MMGAGTAEVTHRVIDHLSLYHTFESNLCVSAGCAGCIIIVTVLVRGCEHGQPLPNQLSCIAYYKDVCLLFFIHTYPNGTDSYTMALVRQSFEFTLVYNPKLNIVSLDVYC